MEEIRNAENAVVTTREPNELIEEIMIAIRDSLTILACSDDEEDGDDEVDGDDEHDEDTVPA